MGDIKKKLSSQRMASNNKMIRRKRDSNVNVLKPNLVKPQDLNFKPKLPGIKLVSSRNLFALRKELGDSNLLAMTDKNSKINKLTLNLQTNMDITNDSNTSPDLDRDLHQKSLSPRVLNDSLTNQMNKLLLDREQSQLEKIRDMCRNNRLGSEITKQLQPLSMSKVNFISKPIKKQVRNSQKSKIPTLQAVDNRVIYRKEKYQ